MNDSYTPAGSVISSNGKNIEIISVRGNYMWTYNVGRPIKSLSSTAEHSIVNEENGSRFILNHKTKVVSTIN